MTKAELISTIASSTGLTKKAAEQAASAFLAAVTGSLAKGEKVQLPGFGTFEVRERAARTARNPQTGEAVEVAASKAVGFKAGKALKDAVKG